MLDVKKKKNTFLRIESPSLTLEPSVVNLAGWASNKYLLKNVLKSCEDAAMNDKTLKCITMMSHEIKPIYRGALCEKYGNNIALASKTALCIWNMWSGVRSFFRVFARRFAVNTNGFRCFEDAIFP